MPISIRCSACDKQFRVADDKAGKRLKCKCGAPITVPASDEPQSADAPSAKSAGPEIADSAADGSRPVQGAASLETRADSFAARRSSSKRRSNRSTAAIVAFSALSAGVAFAGYLYYDRTSTAKPPSSTAGARAPSGGSTSSRPKPASSPSLSPASQSPASSPEGHAKPQTWMDVETQVAEHEVTAQDLFLLLLPAGEPVLGALVLDADQAQQVDVLRREQADVLRTDVERLQSRVAIDPQTPADLERLWRNHAFHYGNRVAKVLSPDAATKLQAAIRAEQVPRFGDDAQPNLLASLYYELTGTSAEASQSE